MFTKNERNRLLAKKRFGLHHNGVKWYFVTKIVLTYCEKKLLNFEAESREFAKFLRSLEQFIQTAKGQNNIW
jgi:hypothetical protein